MPPIRTFAAPVQYRDQPEPDPFIALQNRLAAIQAIQTAPQTFQAQQELLALQQLERQLATQRNQQAQQDLRDPTGAFLRDLQKQAVLKSVDPTSGVIPAVQGFETEAIGVPRAITPEQQAALMAPVVQLPIPLRTPEVAIPRVAPGAPVQPIMVGGRPSGFAQDIESAVAATQALASAKRAPLAQRIAEIEARASASGIPGQVIVDTDGNPQFIPTRAFGGVAPVATEVKSGTGESLKIPAKASAKGASEMTANARSKLIGDYTDLTGIAPDKVLDDLNDNTLSLDKMRAVVGSLQGARKIPAADFKNFTAFESLGNEFDKAEKAIAGLEKEFGPIKGRWNEFLLRFNISEQDPRVAEAFTLINSLAADQIHEKYGGALTKTEENRASKWALDTALPFSTLKARIKSAKGGIASSRSAFQKTLKARNINAPELFESDSTEIIDYPTEADIPSDLPKPTRVTIGGKPAIWE